MEREGLVDLHEPQPVQIGHVRARLTFALPVAVGMQHQAIGLAARTEAAVQLEIVHGRAVLEGLPGAVIEGQAERLLLVGGAGKFRGAGNGKIGPQTALKFAGAGRDQFGQVDLNGLGLSVGCRSGRRRAQRSRRPFSLSTRS